ncbi:MAG TPA: ABC-type transport auxiliary lipoprotein family protein [Alphaproteobacteria bacterium]
MSGSPISRLISRRAWLGLAAAASVAACALGGGDAPQLYTLSPKSTFDPALPQVEWQMIVERPVAAAGLNTQKIALQRTAVTVDYFARAAWTDTAPQLVQTLLIQSFENTGKIRAVTRESTQLRPDYVLQTELREFQAEYEGAGQAPVVRVRLNAKMIRLPDRIIIGNQTVERTVPAAKPDMENIVLAFDEALGKVMKQIVEWTLVTPGTTARPGRPGA